MAVNSFIPVKAVVADHKADADLLTIESQDVFRQRVRIAGEAAGELTLVTSGSLHARITHFLTVGGQSMVVEAQNALGVVLQNLLQSNADTIAVSGEQADGDAINKGPVLVGAQLLDTLSDLALVVDERLGRLVGTRDRRLIIQPHCPPADLRSGPNVGSANDTANHELIAAQGAGVKIRALLINVSNETDTDTAVLIKSANTVIDRIPAPKRSGAIVPYHGALATAANEALNFAAVTAVNQVFVSVHGYATQL